MMLHNRDEFVQQMILVLIVVLFLSSMVVLGVSWFELLGGSWRGI